MVDINTAQGGAAVAACDPPRPSSMSETRQLSLPLSSSFSLFINPVAVPTNASRPGMPRRCRHDQSLRLASYAVLGTTRSNSIIQSKTVRCMKAKVAQTKSNDSWTDMSMDSTWNRADKNHFQNMNNEVKFQDKVRNTSSSNAKDSSKNKSPENDPQRRFEMFCEPSDFPGLDGVFRAERKRILILMSDTGGGHRASAEAIQEAMHKLYPNKVEISIVDFFVSIAGGPFFEGMPEFYTMLAKNPLLWQMVWWGGEFVATRLMFVLFMELMISRRFESALELYKPDLIISVHPLCQSVPIQVLKRKNLHSVIPFITVVSDLGSASVTWFHSEVDLVIVPSKQVYDIGIKCGVNPSKMQLIGLPVRSQFWTESESKAELRQKLGLLDPSVPVALLIGGGDGVGKLEAITKSVSQQLFERLGPNGGQLVVICGKNEALKNKLLSQNWPIPVSVQGFVRNMSEWISASDAVVTKAGPGTIAETCIRGKPILLSSFLPGQEAGNVTFVTNNDAGFFSVRPAQIGQKLASWFQDRELLDMLSQNSRRLGTPNATLEIAKVIGHYALYRDSVMTELFARNPFASSRVI